MRNANSGKLIEQWTINSNYIGAMTFSSDGKYIAFARGNGSITFRSIAVENQNYSKIYSDIGLVDVDASSYLDQLVVANDNGDIQFIDSLSGKNYRSLKGKIKKDGAIMLSPDKKYLAHSYTLMGSAQNNTLEIWGLISKDSYSLLREYKTFGNDYTVSSDWKYLAIGKRGKSKNKKIALVDIKSGKEVNILETISRGINELAFSPDGKYLASSSGRTPRSIQIWEVPSGKLLHTIYGHTDLITALIYNVDGTKLLSGSNDGLVKVWDSHNGKELRTLEINVDSYMIDIKFSPDYKLLAVASDSIQLWNIDTGTLLAKIRYSANNIDFSNDGKYLYSVSGDKTIHKWELDKVLNNKQQTKFPDPKKEEKFFGLELNGINLMPIKLKQATLYKSFAYGPNWPEHHIQHWLPAAKKGDAEAMYQIALIHDRDNNRYRPRSKDHDDNLEALKWYQKALDAGSKKAKERIVFLKNWMKRNNYNIDTHPPCFLTFCTKKTKKQSLD